MPDHYLRRYFYFDPETANSGGGQISPAGVSVGGGFAPPVDVCELESSYELRMEIAGVDPATVDIQAADDGRTVTISGLRQASPVARRGRFLNLEIQYGDFVRRIVLPEIVDSEAAKAAYRDGFLVIELPKRPEATKRRVPITQGP